MVVKKLIGCGVISHEIDTTGKLVEMFCAKGEHKMTKSENYFVNVVVIKQKV